MTTLRARSPRRRRAGAPPRSRTSTASCRGWTSTRASSTRRATSATRCSSGPSSWRSSPRTSTSSSRSASRACWSRSPPAAPSARPTAAPPPSSWPSSGSGSGAWSTTTPPRTTRVRAGLAAEGVAIVDHAAIPEHHARLRERYLEEIFPVLTPLAVAPGHPFPYISTLSLSLAVVVARPRHGGAALRPRQGAADPAAPGRRWTPTGVRPARAGDRRQPGRPLPRPRRSSRRTSFRVTRDADFDVEEDEAGDLLSAIEHELRRRRFGSAVRLEVEEAMPQDDARLHPVGHRPRRGRPVRGAGDAGRDMLLAARHASTSRSSATRRGRRWSRLASSRPTRATSSTSSR